MPPDSPDIGPRWNIPAAVAAWLVPGWGHWLLGEKKRARILACTIGILWLTGFLIGGISIFDHRDHPAWFVGQALAAPSVAGNFALHTLQGNAPPPLPDRDFRFEPALGRVGEQAILYTALAGLLNLLAIGDVLYRDNRRQAATATATATTPDPKTASRRTPR